MTPSAELAALRVRAYGPRADIDADPAACARLQELEDALRATHAVHAAPTAIRSDAEASPAAPALRADSVLGAGTEAGAEATADDALAIFQEPTPEDSTGPVTSRQKPRPKPVARGWLIGWAASVLVVALVVGALVFTLASITPVSAATGARQVAALDTEIDAPEWLSTSFGIGDGVFYRYRGLIVGRSAVGWYSFQGSECLLAVAEDAYVASDQSLRGNIYTGCAAGAFPATLQFVVDESSPDELSAQFADGAALQFVLVDDVIGVFTDDGVSATPAPGTDA